VETFALARRSDHAIAGADADHTRIISADAKLLQEGNDGFAVFARHALHIKAVDRKPVIWVCLIPVTHPLHHIGNFRAVKDAKEIAVEGICCWHLAALQILVEPLDPDKGRFKAQHTKALLFH
jgi:hypothetical protein